MAKYIPYIETSHTQPETQLALLPVGIEFHLDAREFSDTPAQAQCIVELCASHTTEYHEDCSEEDPMQPTFTARVCELDKSK